MDTDKQILHWLDLILDEIREIAGALKEKNKKPLLLPFGDSHILLYANRLDAVTFTDDGIIIQYRDHYRDLYTAPLSFFEQLKPWYKEQTGIELVAPNQDKKEKQ